MTNNILRLKADNSVGVQAGVTFCCLRRFHIQTGEDLEHDVIHGYRLWTVTNPTASEVSVNVSASAAEPAYMWSMADSSLNFTNATYFVDKFNEVKFYNGGCGGSSNTTR